MQQIDVQSFNSRLKGSEPLILLDVREEIEYHTYNIGGINIPLSQLTEKLALVTPNKSTEIIVICKAGLRSQTAQAILIQNGFTNVKNLTGGLLAMQRMQA
jgi:rhodanese-related sulfurtransferase